MNTDRPDIANLFEDLQASFASHGLAPAVGQSPWRMSCRFWLLSLSIHALLLLLAFVFGGSRPFGRGGNPEGFFFSATFFTGESGSSGRAGAEIDTTIRDDVESAATTFPPFREVGTAEISRPLLTLTPADPDSVFADEPSESFTAELAALQNAPRTRRPTQPRPQNDVKKSATSTAPAPQDVEVLENDPRNLMASATSRATATDIGENINEANAAGRPGSRDNGLKGRSDNPAGEGDGGSSSGSADGNRTTFFGIGAKAKRFVYVIDASESMHQHRAMQVAREELWESLQELTESVTFQVVFFNLKQHTLSRRGDRPKLLAATASNLRLAKQFLNGIQPDSGTDRLAALTHAFSFEPDVIFLLTDADAPELSAKDLADIRRLNRRKTVINVVEFGKLPDIGQDNFLKALARQHGGSHRHHNLMRPDGR